MLTCSRPGQGPFHRAESSLWPGQKAARARTPSANATCFLHSRVRPSLSKPDASTSTPRREKHTDHQLVEADTSQSGNVEKSCEIGWEGQGEYLSTIVMCIQICSISRVLQLRSRSCLTAFPGSMLFYDIVARKSALLLPYPCGVLHNHTSQGIRRENCRREGRERGGSQLPVVCSVYSFHIGIRCDSPHYYPGPICHIIWRVNDRL